MRPCNASLCLGVPLYVCVLLTYSSLSVSASVFCLSLSSEFSGEDGFDLKARNGLLDSLSEMFDIILPPVLLLRDKDRVRVADHKIVRDVLDRKLTIPLAMLVVLMDGVLLLAMLFCFVISTFLMLRHGGPLTTLETSLLALSLLCDLYILCREISQAKSMTGITGTLFSWASDVWNMLDCTCIISVMVVSGIALFGKHETRSKKWFHILVALSSFVLWLNFIGYIRVLNQKLATFVCKLFVFHSRRDFLTQPKYLQIQSFRYWKTWSTLSSFFPLLS